MPEKIDKKNINLLEERNCDLFHSHRKANWTSAKNKWTKQLKSLWDIEIHKEPNKTSPHHEYQPTHIYPATRQGGGYPLYITMYVTKCNNWCNYNTAYHSPPLYLLPEPHLVSSVFYCFVITDHSYSHHGNNNHWCFYQNSVNEHFFIYIFHLVTSGRASRRFTFNQGETIHYSLQDWSHGSFSAT